MSWVMWVMGHLCDGSRGSWVTKDDPFPSLWGSLHRSRDLLAVFGEGKGEDGRKRGGERREGNEKGPTRKNPGYGLVRLLSDCFPPACSAVEFD